MAKSSSAAVKGQTFFAVFFPYSLPAFDIVLKHSLLHLAACLAATEFPLCLDFVWLKYNQLPMIASVIIYCNYIKLLGIQCVIC